MVQPMIGMFATAAFLAACSAPLTDVPIAPTIRPANGKLPQTIEIEVDNESALPARLGLTIDTSARVVPPGRVTPSLAPPHQRIDVSFVPPPSEYWAFVAATAGDEFGILFESHDVGACRGRLTIVVHVNPAGVPSWTAAERIC